MEYLIAILILAIIVMAVVGYKATKTLIATQATDTVAVTSQLKELKENTPRLVVNENQEAILTTASGEEILNYKLSKN